MKGKRLLFGPLADDDLPARTKGDFKPWWQMVKTVADTYAATDPGPQLCPPLNIGRDTLWYRHVGEGAAQLALAYRATGDKKYLKRTAKIGQWIFDTQLGKGDVRGWCQQYKADNTPASGWASTRVMPSASATRQACWPAAPPKLHSVYSVTS